MFTGPNPPLSKRDEIMVLAVMSALLEAGDRAARDTKLLTPDEYAEQARELLWSAAEEAGPVDCDDKIERIGALIDAQPAT